MLLTQVLNCSKEKKVPDTLCHPQKDQCYVLVDIPSPSSSDQRFCCFCLAEVVRSNPDEMLWFEIPERGAMSVYVIWKVNDDVYAGNITPEFIKSGKMIFAMHNSADMPNDIGIVASVY